MRSFGKTGYVFMFILKVSPDGISHALVHHTLVIWEALRASLIYWVPGLVRDPPNLKRCHKQPGKSLATWEGEPTQTDN